MDTVRDWDGEGSSGRLWEIGVGVPGPFRPRPERWAAAGTVLRTELWDDPEHPFPSSAPGYRCDGERRVSAVVTTVREAAPMYCRDEDGNQPTDLIGVDGWYHRVLVRPATGEEAAEILKQEVVQARRARLRHRRAELFGTRALQADGVVPAEGDVSFDGTVKVPFGAELERSGYSYASDDVLRVDEARGVAYWLIYNGRDGDDWSASNAGSYIAVRYPLTPERAELVTDLRAEYEVATWGQAGVGVEAARALIRAGWAVEYAEQRLGAFLLTSAEDVQGLLARPWDEWKTAKWENSRSYTAERFTVADAVRLADAGVSYYGALQRKQGGARTVEEIIAAQHPGRRRPHRRRSGKAVLALQGRRDVRSAACPGMVGDTADALGPEECNGDGRCLPRPRHPFLVAVGRRHGGQGPLDGLLPP
ncbi:hypothetical protein AB0942_33970 [Streptomyces nodosus]|uniref:hypothetical protein n=1 Tax=Streptomyces nodosus TaxID=40318 RepID=UPI00345365D3